MKFDTVDFPIDEMVQHCDRILNKHPGAEFYQKWTCAHCGSRQTMDAPNEFFTFGKCEACSWVTTITHCNVLYVARFPERTGTNN